MQEKTQSVTPKAYSRYLGFRHRVKMRVVDGEPTEPLPSKVIILNLAGGEPQVLELKNEQDELDFINGMLPTNFRYPDPMEDLSTFDKPWQIVWRKVKKDETPVERHSSQCKFVNKRGKPGEPTTQMLSEVVVQVPCEWTGLKPGDALAMCLGGSGDYVALSAANRLHSMGGELFRIPSFKLKGHRGVESKDDDALLLAQLVQSHREDFYPTRVRDMKIIMVRETFNLRTIAMKDRMATAQRLRERNRNRTFCSMKGGFPEGDIEKRFEELQTTDEGYLAVLASETAAHKDMEAAVEETDVWKRLFEDLPGVGPAIAARIISSIIDIRRFSTAAKLKKFMGVHVLADGTFPRRRHGVVANWHPDARQALYLLADQFVKKPDSEWGKKLKGYKAAFRKKYPQVCAQVKPEKLDLTLEEAVELGLSVDKNKKLIHIPIGDPGTKAKKTYKVKHPLSGEEIEISGPQCFGDGHLHQRAIWRTLSRFVEWLHRSWWALEREARKAPVVDAENMASLPETSTTPHAGESDAPQQQAAA